MLGYLYRTWLDTSVGPVHLHISYSCTKCRCLCGTSAYSRASAYSIFDRGSLCCIESNSNSRDYKDGGPPIMIYIIHRGFIDNSLNTMTIEVAGVIWSVRLSTNKRFHDWDSIWLDLWVCFCPVTHLPTPIDSQRIVDSNALDIIYRGFSVRLQYLQCVSNGDTAVFYLSIIWINFAELEYAS